MKVLPALAGAQGHRHTKHSCTQLPKLSAQSCKVHLVCCSAPLLLTPRGQLQCIPDWHPAQNRPTLSAWEGEEMQVKRSGNQRDPHGLGSYPALAPSASFPWHLVCKFVLHTFINWRKSFFSHSTAELGLCLFLQFQTTQGRQDL